MNYPNVTLCPNCGLELGEHDIDITGSERKACPLSEESVERLMVHVAAAIFLAHNGTPLQ